MEARHKLWASLAALLVSSLLWAAQAASPLKTYTNVYGRVTCYAEALVKPESTTQLAAAVKQFAAASKASGKPLKIRTSRSVFHSTASFTCPFTSDVIPTAPDTSSASPSTAAVMLEDFNKILEVDKKAYTVRVQAGLKVLDLLRWADENGMATAPGAPTNYAELTIGGVISANGHGTGSNVTSSMGDIALEFVWIDASGTVHTSSRDSAEGHGLAGGLGLIGIITTTPNLAFMWRPDLKVYNAFLMSLTNEPAQKGDAAGLVFPLPTPISNAFQLVLLPWQADVSNGAVTHALNPMNCLTSFTTIAYLRWASKSLLPSAPGAPLSVAVAQAVAVGSTNKMMAGGCEPYCMWNSDLTVDDIEFAIEMDDFGAWADDVKKIIQMDLQENGRKPDRCMPFGGYIFVRFGKGNSDYTAVTSGMKSPVYVELTYVKTRKLPGVPAKFQYVQDVIEQLTLCKYKGRPHYGKNYDRTFSSAKCAIRDRLPLFKKQLELQAKYDPDKVFESILMRQVIDKSGNFFGPQCDLKRQCYCEENSHCANGFACVPSAAFPEYKVCKPAAMVHGIGFFNWFGKR